MRVLRISHSGVVSAWRQRERELVSRGVDVQLLSAARWEEGGGIVELDVEEDAFATAATTYGRHPNLFLFDPRVLWRLLGDDRVDLLDIHEEPFSLAMAEILLVKALRRNRAPYVVYSAQNLDKHYPLPFSSIERRALRHAAGAQVCNVAAGDRLRRRGLTGRLAVLALGVDLARFHPDDRPPPVGPPLRVGYCGRLAAHKGVQVLLEAMAPLDAWVLETMGDGPDRAWLEARARELGMGHRLVLHGHGDQDELAVFYRGLDVLVVPSIPTPSWTEQFGRVAIEAMASGVPVISSDAGALPEVVGDAGLVFPAGDAAGLREQLVVLGGSPDRWCALRETGLERAKDFTWAAVADHQLELYRGILG